MNILHPDEELDDIPVKQNGNVFYFPLWKIRLSARLKNWTIESRYLYVISGDNKMAWTHSCPKMGAIVVPKNTGTCKYCGADCLNEPFDEDIIYVINKLYPPE